MRSFHVSHLWLPFEEVIDLGFLAKDTLYAEVVFVSLAPCNSAQLRKRNRERIPCPGKRILANALSRKLNCRFGNDEEHRLSEMRSYGHINVLRPFVIMWRIWSILPLSKKN